MGAKEKGSGVIMCPESEEKLADKQSSARSVKDTGRAVAQRRSKE